MIMIAVNRHWLSAICFMWLGTILAQSEHLQGLQTSNAYSSKLCRYQRDGLQCTILQSHRGRMSRYHALLSSRIRKGGGPGCNTRNGPKPHSSNRARMGDFSCSLPLAEIFGIIFRTTGPNLPNWYLRPYAGRFLNTNTVSLSAAPLEWPEERERETRYHLEDGGYHLLEMRLDGTGVYSSAWPLLWRSPLCLTNGPQGLKGYKTKILNIKLN